jgi:hypothetical protein
MTRTLLALAGLLLAACNVNSPVATGQGTLDGLLSFAPDAVLVFVRSLPDGGVDTSITDIDFTRSTPVFTCADYGGQFPDAGLLEDALDIELQTYPGQIPAGTYSIASTVNGCAGAFCNFLSLYGATDPPSSVPAGLAGGVSGSITLTKVGAEYAGSFTAVVAFEDGGESELSGTFDTTTVCLRAE